MGKYTSRYKKRERSVENLKEKIESDKGKNFGDDRYWKLEVDKSGNGRAVIRFLPAVKDEEEYDREVSYVKTLDYSFKGPGGWYIERSRVTLANDYDDDPVSVLNNQMWNSGNEEKREIVRKRRLNKNYHANIYVVDDPANPSNNGKVFLFRFGAEILEKIQEVLAPEFDDDDVEVFNPFDLFEGADFKIKARNGTNSMRTYDKSSWAKPAPLRDADKNELDEDELERILESTYPIMEMCEEGKHIKSYADLQSRLNRVLQLDTSNRSTGDPLFGSDDNEEEFDGGFKEDESNEGKTQEFDDDDEDEDLESFFAGLSDDSDEK